MAESTDSPLPPDPVVDLFEGLYFARESAMRLGHLNYFLQSNSAFRCLVLQWLLKPPPALPIRTPRLKILLGERVPSWQIEQSQRFIGDLGETIAKLWPADPDRVQPAADWASIAELVAGADADTVEPIACACLDVLSEPQRWLFLLLFVKRTDWKVDAHTVLEALQCGAGADPALLEGIELPGDRFPALVESQSRRSACMALLYAEKARGARRWLSFTLGLQDAAGVWIPVAKVEPCETDALEQVRLQDWTQAYGVVARGPIVEFEQRLVVEIDYGSVRSAARRKCGIELENAVMRSVHWESGMDALVRLEVFLLANLPVAAPLAQSGLNRMEIRNRSDSVLSRGGSPL